MEKKKINNRQFEVVGSLRQRQHRNWLFFGFFLLFSFINALFAGVNCITDLSLKNFSILLLFTNLEYFFLLCAIYCDKKYEKLISEVVRE